MKSTFLKIIVILFLSTLTTSCLVDVFNKVKGNGNVVTENRKINESFTKIKASNGLDVFITQSKKPSVTVEADQNLQDIIKVEVVNGVLKVYTDKNIGRSKAKKIYITATEIESITASSGSDVISENTITATTFKANASSGGYLKLALNVGTLSSNSSSGANLKLTGTAKDYTAKASSGSITNAYKLASQNVTVKVSSGANINIFASESIIAKASSGGDIDYKGNPKKSTIKKSSGGSVSAH